MKHAVTEYKLSNGQMGLIIDAPGSEVATLQFAFRSGNVFTDPAKFEVPHVMEHMMASGSKLYPSAIAFKTEVEKNGAYRNAFTSAYLNWYEYESARFEFERILGLAIEQVTQPLFPEVSFATEISNVREELSQYTSEWPRIAYMNLAEKTAPSGNLNYPERIRQLSSLTHEDITSYYRQTHTARNAYFFIAGDFNGQHDKILQQLELGFKAAGLGQKLRYQPKPLQDVAGPIYQPESIMQIYYNIRIGFQAQTKKEERSLQLLLAMLTQGYRSWIKGEARERGLAYTVSSLASINPDNYYVSVGAYVTREQSVPMFELIARSFQRAAAGEFAASEIDEARSLVIGSLKRSFQTPRSLINWYRNAYSYKHEIEHFDDCYAELASITSEDIIKAAKSLKSGQGAISLLGEIDKTKAEELYNILRPIWSE